MVRRKMVLALGAIAAVTSAPVASEYQARMTSAPTGTAETRYCMRIAPPTGSHIERTKCWTRQQWTDQGVDIDRDWAREGVRTLD